jgi:hypothetical protein
MRKIFRSEKLLIKLAIKRKELIKVTKSSKLTLIKVEMLTRILVAALKAKQVIAIRFQVNRLNNLQTWGRNCKLTNS